GRVGAGRRAEQRDRLALREHRRQLVDQLVLRLHFLQIALAVSLPADGWTVLAVEIGVQLARRAEVGTPTVPGLVLLGDAARPVAADKEAVAIVRLAGVVPALGFEGHDWQTVSRV